MIAVNFLYKRTFWYLKLTFSTKSYYVITYYVITFQPSLYSIIKKKKK